MADMNYLCNSSKSKPLPLKECIRHFTPAWHAVIMGTGAISLLFHSFPYGSENRGMQITALFFLLLNIALFVIITSFTAARYIIFRGMWSSMIHHPSQSLFLGCFPMGFATIIISSVEIVYTFFGYGGTSFLYILWGLWWLDVVASLLICFGQLHMMFTRQTHEISSMTMVWLLPVVTPIVVSSAGAIVGQAMIPINVSYVCLTLAVGMALVTIGITLSLSVITIYLHRLIVYKLPTGITVFSFFLPLGPLGQSGFAFLLLGEISSKLFPLNGSSATNIFVNIYTPHIIYAFAWLASFALWILATCWLLLGVMALGDVLTKHAVHFKITFWGMIFPNGVYANLTIQLSDTIDSRILRIWGSIYAVCTFGLWLFAMVRTLPSLRDGSIFEDLCVAMPERPELSDEIPTPSTASASRSVCELRVASHAGGELALTCLP